MKDVINSIVGDISNCKNEQKALTMASTAFGTMGEDANLKVVKSLTTAGDAFNNVKGTMEGIKDVRYTDTENSIESLKRTIITSISEPIANEVLPAMKSLSTINWNEVGQQIGKAMGKGVDIFKWIIENKDTVITAIEAMLAAFALAKIVKVVTELGKIIQAVKSWELATKAQAAAQWLLNVALNANPIGIIITLIAALVGAFVVLWNKSEGFRNFWIGLWEEIKSRVQFAWNVITTLFKVAWETTKKIWTTVAGWFNEHIIQPIQKFNEMIMTYVVNKVVTTWNNIKLALGTIANWFNENVVQPIKKFVQPWVDFFTSVFNVIKELAVGCWNLICIVWSIAGNWFNEHVIQPIKSFFEGVWNFISEQAKIAWNNIVTIWQVVSGWFNENVIQPIKNFFEPMWNALKNGAANAWEGIKGIFSKVSSFFGKIFSDAWNNVKAVFSVGGKIFDGLKEGIVENFKNIVNAIIRGINKAIAFPFNKINDMLEKIQKINIAGAQPFSGLNSRISIPQIPELAQGTVVKKGHPYLLEGKGDEAVVPLHNNKKWIKKVAEDMINSLDNTSNINGLGNSITQKTNNFTQVINSPKPLTRLEIYRQTRNLIKLKQE
jgi:phage-related protein